MRLNKRTSFCTRQKGALWKCSGARPSSSAHFPFYIQHMASITVSAVTLNLVQSHVLLCFIPNSWYWDAKLLFISSTSEALFGREFSRKLFLNSSAIDCLDEQPFTTGEKWLLFLEYRLFHEFQNSLVSEYSMAEWILSQVFCLGARCAARKADL